MVTVNSKLSEQGLFGSVIALLGLVNVLVGQMNVLIGLTTALIGLSNVFARIDSLGLHQPANRREKVVLSMHSPAGQGGD